MSENNKKLLDNAYGYFVRSMKKCESLTDSVEKQDMLARLFSNLGLVKENLGDYKTSLNLYEKSIKICKKHDIYEQLYRGYLSMASLFEKQEMYQETVKNYNMAIEIAKKLSSKRVELICAALLAKAETLIRISDLQGAKQILRKAYKFKTPNKEERKVIEMHLRVVAGMCKVEDDIITCNDQKELKRLYEKMGDGACDLKNYSKAIEYYKKMLEAAEKTGVSDKELGECYYSLGETYKDLGNFKEAEFYLEKEYELCKNTLKESLNTICKIADLKEMANADINEIKKIYERGLMNCKKKNNIKEEKRIILRYIDFLKRFSCHKDAFKLDQYLNKLNEKAPDNDDSSSSECESEDSSKVHVGDDIVLSDITDLSEESDNEVPEMTTVQPSKRRKPNTVKFKKNLNGEWPLHIACIKGNAKMVQYWLEVDHPVNVRDNAGWLPLHEAAVHGHLEIVRMLLDAKASINDRGGSECNGVTPLHDAASNGHLEVMELLLDRGASALAKMDDGNTPLTELRKWYSRVDEDLPGEKRSLYNKVIKRLESSLEKAGQKEGEKSFRAISESPGKENRHGNSSNVGKLRREIYLDERIEEDMTEEESPESEIISQTSNIAASNEYQMVMQSFRHKNYSQKPQKIVHSSKPATSKRSALINESDFVDDDWLEDDLGPSKNKKRKSEGGDFIWGRNRSFGGGSTSSRSPAKSVRSDITENDFPEDIPDLPASLFNEDFNDFALSPRKRNSGGSSGENQSSTSWKRTQVTLLDSGFSRERTANRSPVFGTSRHKPASTTQPKITNFGSPNNIVVEADSTTIPRDSFRPVEATQRISDPMLYVDVEIEGKCFRVPILMSQLQVKTIRWLADEASQRYESKEFMKPVLELETVSGVILGDNDVLTLLFPMGGMQAEKVVGKVKEWSQASVFERYKETCNNMGVEIDTDLCDLIQTLSITLDISDRGFLGHILHPLLKSINNQKAITEINLSGNFLNCQCINLLCASITTLPNLQLLNLSCTNLRKDYLSQLASTIHNNANSLEKLSILNLSDNILLKNACMKDIGVISNDLSLKELNLSNIGLTEGAAKQDTLCLKTVEHLDVSYNGLTDGDIRSIMLWLDGNVIKTLNVSRNKSPKLLRQILEVFQLETLVVLEKINLEACNVNDSDLFDFLRLAPNVTSLNLTYNPDLTSISLRRLLEHNGLSYVNVTACSNIWTYFDPMEKGWTVQMSRRAEFHISEGNGVCWDSLSDLFKEKYGESLEIERSSRSLRLIGNSLVR
ncbi:tonsoku-like protein isoform X2 [Anthonomus grandis grandis]|nr:tonsoku-like protein isoform X2 [Anthonomus grandis grandis]